MLIYWFWTLSDQFWGFLKVYGKLKKSKNVDPRGPPFENKTLLWRHMTSPAEVVDFNGNIFGRIICPLSFVVIALIFSELRGGGGIRPPRSHKTKKSPVWIRLKACKHKILLLKCEWCAYSCAMLESVPVLRFLASHAFGHKWAE